MSYNDRIEAAHAVIKEHNDAVGGVGKPGFVDPEEFISCIKSVGGTSLERLSQLSHEDILECLPEVRVSASGPGLKPRILAKAIAAIFRNKEAQVVDEKRPVSGKKADRMTPRELIESFDPEDSANTIGQRLATISRGEPFVVYSNGRLVDADTTLKLLLEVKQGFKGRKDIEVGGNIKKVYRLGELPENYADENPLYRGRPLRPDGTCDQTGRSWDGVAMEARQLVRIAMDVGELKVSHEQAHDILDMVMELDAVTRLRKRYRTAAIKFDELQKTGSLPVLKIELGGSEGENPFGQEKKSCGEVTETDPCLVDPHYKKVVSSAKWRVASGGTYTSNISG